MSKREAHALVEDLLKTEAKLLRWRQKGIGLIMTQDTYQCLSETDHPQKNFVLQGVLVDRRGKLRY